MISGPVQPNTVAALRELVLDPDVRVEQGLRIVAEELTLADGTRIDAVGRDAVGRAVLVLLATGEPGLLARVLAARAFAQRNGHTLEGMLHGEGRGFTGSPRLLVVALHLDDSACRDLAGLAAPELTALQLEVVGLAGQRRVLVQELVGPGARGAERQWTVPCGILDGPARQRCARLLDVLQRLDPELPIEGGRFSRRIALRGRPLCRLWVDDERLVAAVGEQVEGEPLLGDDEVEECADRVLRRYLELLEPVPVRPEERQGGPGRRELALDPLRRSVAEARVTREEYHALGEESSFDHGGGARAPT